MIRKNVCPWLCLLVFLLLQCFPAYLIAQPYTLKLESVPAAAPIVNKIKVDDSYPDSLSVSRKCTEVLTYLRDRGYLLAELRQLSRSKKEFRAIYALGEVYSINNLQPGNVPLSFFEKAGLNRLGDKSPSVNTGNLQLFFRQLLKVYEDNGYPFASVKLDSVRFSGNKITAVLQASSGNQYTFDTLQIAGNVRISRKYLESYLDVEPGTIYRSSIIENIEERLRELPFLSSAKKPQVKYTYGKAKVIVYLQKQSSNQFDGILGLIPDSKTQKLQFTGNLKLHLQNSFKKAEVIDFNFQSLTQNTKELDLGLSLSELYSTPLGLAFKFNLYRQDTSFQNVSSKLALAYRLPKGNMSFFIDNLSGLPIASDSLGSSLTQAAKTSFLGYGFGLNFKTLNDAAFPTRGILADFSAEAGKRKVVSSTVADTGSVTLGAVAQYRVSARLEYYRKIALKGALKVSNTTGLILGKDLYLNELYRIGGFSSLRGFNEQSILASQYSIFNLEYRFLIESKSFLFVFANQAFTKTSSQQLKGTDQPLGFGAGLSLQVKTGAFSISYALGKQKDNPLNLQGGKIHFGLVTLF